MSSSSAATNARSEETPEIVLLAAVLVLTGCALGIIYGRALGSPFIYDDRVSIRENSSIVNLWPLLGDSEHPGPLNPPNDITTSGRPLANLSLALNYHFGQLDPTGYHVFNVIVHLLSAMLLLAIVRGTLRLDFFGGRFDRASGPLALTVALLWALHPLQTETVIYVTQRTELLVGFFYLATLYGSLRYWGAGSPTGRAGWLALTTLACLAGMACKEVMVTAPVIVLLFERTFISRSFRRAVQKSWLLYIGLGLGWVLLLLLNFAAPRSHTAGFHLGVPAIDWWLTQTKVLWMYLQLAVWPWPLAIHYEMPYLTTVAAAWPWLLLTTLLGIATLALLWRRNPIGFVGAWILLILSPTLLVPIITEVAAERRMYLPLAGLTALAVVGGYSLVQYATGKLRDRSANLGTESTSRWPVAVTVATALVLAVAFSLVSVRRLAAYHNELTLWQTEIANRPDDSVAQYNLGKALSDAGLSQEAIQHYQQALRTNPEKAEAANNLGVALIRTGHLQEAIAQFQQALQVNPAYSEAHNNLGVALFRMGQPQEAIEHFAQALQFDPSDAQAHYNWGKVLAQTNRWQEAIDHYRQAVVLKPNYTESYGNLAKAYAEMNRSADAIEAAQRALELARSQGQTALAQQVDSWLTNYRLQQANSPHAAPPFGSVPPTQ